jgi:4-amino-4-deoxy-L-arabinose transferase-like glycosyltransferase
MRGLSQGFSPLRRWHHWPHTALAVLYWGLAVYFLVFNFQPIWLGVSAFMGLVSLLVGWLRVRKRDLAARQIWPPVAALLRPMSSLSPSHLALPIPLMGSWFAGQIALEGRPDTNYWRALALWLSATALFVALLIPGRQVFRKGNLARAWASVPWLEVGAVLLITLVAFGARAINVVNEPNPFSGDEANFGLQALQVSEGLRRNMFSTGVPFGQPSIYYFIIDLSNKVFGVGVLATRAPSVFFGVTTIPLTYLLLRELFNRRVALVGAAFLAVYDLHIHFSRVGLNNISAAWITVLTLYFAARATRTQKPLDFGLAGAAAGLSLYSYVGARIAPVVLGLYFCWVVLANRRFLLANLGNFLVLLAGFAVVAGPQGLFFFQVPDEFYASQRWANIFASGWLQKEEAFRHASAMSILVDQFHHAFAVLVVEGEHYHHYNAQVPLIDGVSRWPFFLGGVLALVHIRQPRYFLLLVLLILTVVTGAALSFPPPSAARLVTLTPAVAGLIAVGVVAAADFVARFSKKLPLASPALILALVGLMAFVNLHFYFAEYLPDDRYVPGDNDVTYAVGRYMAGLGPEYVGYWFGAPRIYAGDPTISFIGHDRTIVDVPQGARQLPPVTTPEPNATFMFLPEREDESVAIREACPGGEWKQFWDNHDQRYLFYAYELRDGQACVASAGLAQAAPQPGLQPAPQPSPQPSPQPPSVMTKVPGDPAQRDRQRRNDLENIKHALEQYYDDKGSYPNTGGQMQTLCGYVQLDVGCALRQFLDPIPNDPAGDPLVNGYWYASDGQSFGLFALQETTIDPAATDCPFYSEATLGNKQVGFCVSGAH